MATIEEVEAGGYLILAFVVLGVVVFIGYEVVQGGKTLDSAVNDLLDKWGFGTGNAPSVVPGNTKVSQSVGGYDAIGTDGVNYSCDKNNMCTPIQYNSDGTSTVVGPPIDGNTVGISKS